MNDDEDVGSVIFYGFLSWAIAIGGVVFYLWISR